jgi:DNA polymerase II large subunit
MEDKGGFLSKLFRRKKEEPQAVAAPTTQPEKPSMPSAAEDRQKRMAERQKQEKQAVDSYAMDQNTGKQAVTEIKDTRPEAIKPKVEKIGTEQTLEQAAEKQEKFSPKGTPGERFKKLTQTEPSQTPPTSPIKQAERTTEAAAESPKSTISEQRIQELDAERLEKSLQTPTSEWGKPKHPSSESKQDVGKTKPAYPPQEELKKAA